MIFAIRRAPSGRSVLAEFKGWEDYLASGAPEPMVTQKSAQQFVKDGMEHETGFWVDGNGVVQYAEREGENR